MKTDYRGETMPTFLPAETRYNTRIPQHRELKVSTVKYYVWLSQTREIGYAPGQALMPVGANTLPHRASGGPCSLSLSAVKYLHMKTGDPQNRDHFPILTDFFVCDSWEEARSLVLRSDWPEAAYNWALILDHNLGRARLLGFFCPGCCSSSSAVVREMRDRDA